MDSVEIKIIGPKNPCKKCRSTKTLLEDVVKQNFTSEQQKNITISHVNVSAPETIEEYGLLDTPAVVINDTVVTEGEIPKKDYIKGKLSEL